MLTCLDCGYTGCGSPPHRHLLRHCLTQLGDGHCFAASRARAEIFCARCCDYVYDVEFDAAISRTDDDFGLTTEWDAEAGREDTRVRARRRRRARGDGYYLTTGKLGHQPGREQSWPPPVLLSPARSRLVAAGVRGMFNLGNTCFMSSVLQVCACVCLIGLYMAICCVKAKVNIENTCFMSSALQVCACVSDWIIHGHILCQGQSCKGEG